MKKSLCSVILIFMMIFSVLFISASASASEIIDSAEITVNINTDGTAEVTEKWTVSYLGSSDVFFRNFDVFSVSDSMTLLQNYDEIKDIEVMIDGNRIVEAENGINTYSVTENDRTIEIAVNCPSAQTTREYQIDYVMTGAVKEFGKDACFSVMLLGESFVYTSNNVRVDVIFPEGTTDVRISDNSDGTIENNKASFMSKRVFDTFSVEVYADNSQFEKGALASYSKAKEGLYSAGNLFIQIIPWVLAVVFSVIVIVFVLFPDRIRRIPMEKNAKKILKNNADVSLQLPDTLSPCTAYKMLEPVSRIRPKASSKKVPVLFAAAILECIDMGYIIPDSNELIVGTPNENVPAYISSVLNFLKTFSNKKGNKYVIDESFSEKVTNECMTRYDVVANYLATFYSLIPSVSLKGDKNRELYENAYVVKEIISAGKYKTDYARCLGKVLSGADVKDNEVFAVLFNSVSEKTFTPGGRTGEQALCEALLQMYKVFTDKS